MNRIKDLRTDADMTQEDLAKILKVNRSLVSKYEAEAVPLTTETITILTDFFNVSSDYLLGLSNDPTPPGSRPLAIDDEVLELMEEMHKRPELKVLFNTSKKATKEDIEFVDQMIKRMAGYDDENL